MFKNFCALLLALCFSSHLYAQENFRLLAQEFYNNFDHQQAYLNYKKVVALNPTSMNSEDWANLGYTSFELGRNTEAERYLVRSLEGAEKESDTAQVIIVHMMLGINFSQMKDFEQAQKQFEEGEKWNLVYDNHTFAYQLISYKAGLAYRRRDYKEAARLYQDILFFIEDKNSLTYHNMLYNYSNALWAWKKDPIVVGNYKGLVEYYEREGRGGRKLTSLLGWAKVEGDLNNYSKAFELSKQAYEIALDREELGMQDAALEYMVIYNEDHDSNELYLETLFSLKDGLWEINSKKIEDFAHMAYEVDKINESNKELAQSLQIERLEAVVSNRRWVSVVSFVGFIVVLLGAYVWYRKRKLEVERVEELLEQEVEKNQVKNKIAKRLHDEFSTEMTLMSFQLKDPGVRNRFKLLQEGVRTLSHELHEELEELSLEDKLKILMADAFSAGVKIDLIGLEELSLLEMSSTFKKFIYLSVSESVNNALKYADCKGIKVCFISRSKELEVHVIDDGVGFDMKVLKKGLGLKSMAARMEQMGGSFSIDSSIGKGTEIQFKLKIV